MSQRKQYFEFNLQVDLLCLLAMNIHIMILVESIDQLILFLLLGYAEVRKIAFTEHVLNLLNPFLMVGRTFT
jgi:hypothetical protein